MKIYLATDHAGFEMKESVKKYLEDKGYEVVDFGAFTYDEGDDYPDFVRPCAEAVAGDEGSFGIIFGGSGQGEAMIANRVSGVRCAVWYGSATVIPAQAGISDGKSIVELAREHNNANILSIGARFVSDSEVKEAVEVFLNTEFSGEGRHVRRIEKIDQ